MHGLCAYNGNNITLALNKIRKRLDPEVSIRQAEVWIKFNFELSYWHYIAAVSWYMENMVICFREAVMKS